jgi:hypothetical protein
MEVVMNQIRLLLPLLFTLALLRPAYAAESITMVWTNAATAETYEVTAPDDVPLLDVKQQVMTEIGLSALQSPLYVVEKVVVTTTILRGTTDPSTGITTPPTTITTEEYILLNESSTLTELEIVSDDTLRLRQIEVASEDGTTGDTTTDDGTDATTDDAAPVKSGHHHGYKKRHHHHHGLGDKHKHPGQRRFG